MSKTNYGMRAKRDRIAIKRDAAPGGASNPQYTELIASHIHAEILQTSGAQEVRGRQIEATTKFVVLIGSLGDIIPNEQCEITVLTGAWKAKTLYIHHAHTETARSRPVGWMLECGNRPAE